MEKFLVNETSHSGRNDRFEIVDEYPYGYKVWNIGRHNFPFECMIPMCMTGREGNPYWVSINNLKALKVENEDFAKFILHKAGYHTIDEKMFNKLHDIFFYKQSLTH